MQLAGHSTAIRAVEPVTADVISAVRAEGFELVEDDSLPDETFVVRDAEFAART